MNNLIRETEMLEKREAKQLKAIRSHRNRRRIWRHKLAVKKGKEIVIGLMMIIASVALIVLDPSHDATFSIFTIPAGIALVGKHI